MDSLLLDLRFAARGLLRRRVLTAVAVTTMALAIGAATAIFSVVDGVLFRSLPYHNTGELVAVWQTIPAWRTEPILASIGDHVVARLSAPDLATIYTPQSQRRSSLTLFVRTRGDPAAMVASVREAVRSVAPAMPVTATEPVESRIRQSFGEERFRTTVIDLFGALAGVLAVVGIYGVTVRAVTRRTREVGIRVALGATGGSVIRLIVGGTLGGAAIGVAAGLVGSLAASRLLAPYLFSVSAYDPVTFAGILAGLACVSVAATWIPARKASAVAPALVLRGE